MKKLLGCVIALAFFTVGVALAQRADPNTGGPTKNTLGMKVVEPVEGATITGETVRVAVGYNQEIFGASQGTRFGEPNYPQPRFDVYLDGDLKTTLKGTEYNVATLHGVPPGDHKITVVALNVSGEVIDRKEIGIRTQAPVALEKAPEPVRAETAAPAVSAVQPAPAEPPAAVAVKEAVKEKVLPKTASPHAALALAGLALVATGLLLGRKSL